MSWVVIDYYCFLWDIKERMKLINKTQDAPSKKSTLQNIRYVNKYKGVCFSLNCK